MGPRRLSFLWTLSAVVTGSTIWMLYGSAVYPLLSGWSVREVILDFASGVLWTLPFALMTGLVAFPAYVLLTLAFAKAAQQWPMLDSSRLWLALVTGLLALPIALIVSTLMADPYWLEVRGWSTIVLRLGPGALLSAWGGLFLPRLIIPVLKPGAFAARVV